MTKMSDDHIESTHPLTPMQMGMLLDHLIEPGSDVYFRQLAAWIHEQLDITAFHEAWERVVERHTILRTSFRWEGIEEPLQDVHATVDLPFEFQDWRTLSNQEQESQFNEYIELDKKQGFDLRTAPLMRLALFRTGDAEYLFLWSSHHIHLDGRSRYIVLKDFGEYYEIYRKAEEVNVVPAIPFHKHIQWFDGRDFSQSEDYWRQLLRGFTAPVVIDLPAYWEISRGKRAGRGIQTLQITDATTSALKTFAKQNDITLNTLVQGAWAILLSHYSGEEDIVFGAVRANRHSTVEGALDIAGCFINTLPVRLQVSPDRFLIPCLKDLRDQHITIREHEQTPLNQVLGWSQVPRPTPLFESIIVFDNSSLISSLRKVSEFWNSWEIQIIEDTEFPLVLYGTGGDQLTLSIKYDRQRIDDASGQSMLGHLANLLEAMADGSDVRISALPILTASERNKILKDWNDTRVDYDTESCLHEIFEKQVQKTPDALAVSFMGNRLTYRELNQHANQLSHHLIKSGVGPEVLVGVFMERSIELVIALFGILKAGGAYVPLDPEYPAERLAYMIEDTHVPVLLTQERLLSRLPQNDAKVFSLDTDWDTIATESTNDPDSGVMADNLAYVIYTSGSTGKPKGVMNSHRGVVNRLRWMQDQFLLKESDRILQKTPYSFDVSVWEFFWPLLFGAGLIVAQPGGHKDSAYLVKTIFEQEITTIHFVPSMLQVFLQDKELKKCHSLRRVICSGEALPYELQKRFFELLDSELYNLYGPTEAAVDVSYWKCQKDSDLEIVPIGRPVANTQLYILHRDMEPVPVGVMGELHIGGVQVARGYLNHPELTAEKFVPDPFSDEPGARLYKTGDLVRYLPDGSIVFSGRLDHQVKLRGFRIELGEIEMVLSQHSDVHEAAVLAREDMPGDKRIVAYFVPTMQSQPEVITLREFLQRKLPDYMIPSAFVPLDCLPLTPNGKVDRKNLPAPEWETRPEESFLPPEDELEKIIAGIWREVLKIEKVGVNDNFFDLGGHSLLLALAHNQLRDLVDKELSITDLFRFPTIRSLSQYLSQVSGNGDQLIMQESSERAKARRETVMRRSQRRKGQKVTE